MARRKIYAALSLFIVVCLLLIYLTLNKNTSAQEYESDSQALLQSEAKEQNRSGYSDYAGILKAYVDENGTVNYSELKKGRSALDSVVRWVGGLDRRTFENWNEKEKIAFWINAYNALTLQVIIDHYPLKRKGLKGYLYPSSSIRQIPGVWDKVKFKVMGKDMTLDEIEHRNLRKYFNEPRIHMALVCAAIGCPPLRNEPFFPEKLDEQLDDQGREFMSNEKKFRINRNKGVVYISSIFKWFGEDFVKTYGTKAGFEGKNETERAVLNFVSRYIPEESAAFLKTGDYKLKYLDYDWTLNEQKK